VIDPATEPRFFEALELIAWLCDQGGFPKPNRATFDSEQGLVQFGWTEEDFTATWEIGAFLEGVSEARERSRQELV
jgi:hypothetical protein